MTTRGLLVSLILALGCGHRSAPTGAAQAQAEASAVAVGAPAPPAQLIGTAGTRIALADLVHQHAQTVVVFYRGFW